MHTGLPLGSSMTQGLPGIAGGDAAGNVTCHLSHPMGSKEGQGHTPPGERMQKLWEDTGSAGACGHPCTFLGCSPAMPGPNTSYLPQRPFFSEDSHHHAHGNHQAGEDSHEDAQDLGPGREAVAAILGGLVLDDVVHQQGLRNGKKARSTQSPLEVSCSKKAWTSQQNQNGPCCRKCQQSSFSQGEVIQGCWHHCSSPAPSNTSS